MDSKGRAAMHRFYRTMEKHHADAVWKSPGIGTSRYCRSVSNDKATLSSGAQRQVRAFAEALFAREEDEAGLPLAPPKERMDWFVTDIDDFVHHLNLRARLLFLLCIYAVSLLAPLLSGRFGTLAGLPLAARVEALEAFEKTPAALALFAARAVVSLVYYEHPDAAREIHWDRQCLTSTKPSEAAAMETAS